MKNKLWTRDFTIITLGTVVSMLGNCMAGFAIGLLVLDYTGSTLLYAIYMAAYMAPRVIMPIVAGPYLDNFSRKKVIYTLDFISAGLYLVLGFVLMSGFFSYFVLLPVVLIMGSIDSIYQVAYDSFYPALISEGNYSKAYSLSSMIYSFSAIMVPVAAFLYDRLGISLLLFMNAGSFLIAAIFETMIKTGDTHLINKEKQSFSFKVYKEEFRAGVSYIRAEKGLLVITVYFMITMFADSANMTLALPFFKSGQGAGVQMYTYVMACEVIGRLIGGGIHYKFQYKPESKYTIALIVYLVLSVLGGTYLYLPVFLMMICMFVTGLLGVTSYSIRISATQSYVPDRMRGRFNGTFQMLLTVGELVGQLAAGALGEFLDLRLIISAFMGINLLGVLLVMLRGGRHVKQIYNRAV